MLLIPELFENSRFTTSINISAKIAVKAIKLGSFESLLNFTLNELKFHDINDINYVKLEFIEDRIFF